MFRNLPEVNMNTTFAKYLKFNTKVGYLLCPDNKGVEILISRYFYLWRKIVKSSQEKISPSFFNLY